MTSTPSRPVGSAPMLVTASLDTGRIVKVSTKKWTRCNRSQCDIHFVREVDLTVTNRGDKRRQLCVSLNHESLKTPLHEFGLKDHICLIACYKSWRKEPNEPACWVARIRLTPTRLSLLCWTVAAPPRGLHPKTPALTTFRHSAIKQRLTKKQL